MSGFNLRQHMAGVDGAYSRTLLVMAKDRAEAERSAKTTTVSYDVAEQLRTPEEMVAYLDAWFEEAPDDAAGIARALRDISRARGMARVGR